MRIALDARTVYAPQRRGIGRSLLRLYRELAAVRPDWEVVALHRRPDTPIEPIPAPDLAAMPEGFWTPRAIEMPGDRFDAWTRYRLPRAAAGLRVDVLHCPANACPGRSSVPLVVTVHDLIPLDVEHARGLDERRRFDGWMRHAAAAATRVVCVSQHTADAVLARYPLPPERVCVCRHGVDPCDPPAPAAIAQAARRYPLDRPFVLHLGASSPRKNTPRTLGAWARLPEPLRRSHRLLVVGLDADTERRLADDRRRLGVDEGVALHGFAESDDVATLTALADALLFPTLAEGFGLPVLEAFAAGTAVVTSARTSIPEIAGDAAAYVDPEDAASMARGLERVLGDDAYRANLVDLGRARARGFSWRDAAELTAIALEAAASRGVRRAA